MIDIQESLIDVMIKGNGYQYRFMDDLLAELVFIYKFYGEVMKRSEMDIYVIRSLIIPEFYMAHTNYEILLQHLQYQLTLLFQDFPQKRRYELITDIYRRQDNNQEWMYTEIFDVLQGNRCDDNFYYNHIVSWYNQQLLIDEWRKSNGAETNTSN